MDETKLETLDLHPKIAESTKQAKLFTFRDVLILSMQELQLKTKLSDAFASHLIKVVSRERLKSKITSALKLKRGDCETVHRQSKLFLSHRHQENFILTRTITEISGESSSGKTQLCLQLAALAQLPVENGGLAGEVAYICTEERFPLKRFEQIADKLKNYPQYRNIRFSDNVSICHIKSLAQMLLCLKNVVPSLLKKPIKLFIIDSVAAIFRSQYEKHEYTKRARDLQNFGNFIWKLANEQGIAVVCVNQVSAAVNKIGFVSSVGSCLPTLGMVWANLITTRIMLAKTNLREKTSALTVRSLSLVFSSYLPNFTHHFVVTECGVVFLKSLDYS